MPTVNPTQPNPVEQYILGIAARKVTVGVTKLAAAIGGSVVAHAVLAKYGHPIDTAAFVPVASGILMAAIEAGLDYAKVRYGLAWL